MEKVLPFSMVSPLISYEKYICTLNYETFEHICNGHLFLFLQLVVPHGMQAKHSVSEAKAKFNEKPIKKMTHNP